ncbi:MULTISPECIES: DUF3124 domain-containing protein [Bizionia]|uniref:DUF3124 domain-containing protein n=1 Tax=Bizionia algoritergicola TaxID=291187 RepID=A0A5D0QYX9_9FLAO|nr:MULTISPECIES: DUF3124 domain-containing protein [Bizionia]OBX21756.1 hypothetical protein BAA08_11405 [Bizionia sp. APA-3]TYB73434.1 DUF3124 domain-containing protein [Bizionia algoritergicola]
MKRISICLFLSFTCLISCNEKQDSDDFHAENWNKRHKDINPKDSLEHGKTYLSIYSQIYSMSQHKTHNLTAMASMRNTSDSDTIYIVSAKYYDSHGQLIRTYFDKPIYLAPLETTEAIIEEVDVAGGTGSNFIFEWRKSKDSPEPLFEGIMNSTLGQQGLSFTTSGKRIK